jgi:hypothetical protein
MMRTDRSMTPARVKTCGFAECYIGRFGDFGGCGDYRASKHSWCGISEKHYI